MKNFTRNYKIMRITALTASILIAIQVTASLLSGSILCPNSGCEVVESLTTISPQLLNVWGFIFFQIVFWLLYIRKTKLLNQIDLLGLLLIAGLAFETALLAYQIFIAHALCSYCLVIFAFVIVLNLLYGRSQTAAGIAVSAAILISFSVLTFFPTGAQSQTYSLKEAAYAVKSCSSPTKEVYLIFSSDCPHCQNVIQTLNNCNSCDLYLNPIDNLSLLNMDELERIQSFSPEINRLVLSVLGIDSVPVLVVKTAGSYRFIRGERRIINFIERACFTQDNVLYLENSLYSEDKEITVLTEQEEECSVEIDCNPQ
jgi:uncharacterized membrane protein